MSLTDNILLAYINGSVLALYGECVIILTSFLCTGEALTTVTAVTVPELRR